MENKLEQLLNSLIEKGWEPMWYEAKFVEQQKNWKIHIYCSHWYYSWYRETLRTLTLKESWLWQFVCENKLIKKDRFTWMISPDPLWEYQYNYTDYRYRLIESALKDESELEQFLLDHIKV